MKYETIALKG